MSKAYIRCRCGAYGVGSATPEVYNTVTITKMPEEWHGEDSDCEHDESDVVSVEIFSPEEENYECT